jgi:DNA-binding MarR family transcriptional regulator
MGQYEIMQLLKSNKDTWYSLLDLCDYFNLKYPNLDEAVRKLRKYNLVTYKEDIIDRGCTIRKKKQYYYKYKEVQ